MSITIAQLPTHERPRERLSALGASALTDRELLALILRSGMKGKSAIDLAAELLAEHGGIEGIRRARFEELAQWPGIGPAKAASLIAGLSLGQRGEARPERVTIRNAEDVARVASVELANLRHERVIALVCNSRNVLQKVVTVSDGSADRAMFPVREILNAVLRNDGRSFAVAHNHPSGDANPSVEDRQATHRIRVGAANSGLRFLGHVVVGDQLWDEAKSANE
jgi:DNA repair protein RadC